MQSASIRIIAMGDVEIDLDIAFNDEEWEIDSAWINGRAFEWQRVTVDGKPFDDVVAAQVSDELDGIGWASGQQAADRADDKRKES